jgi:hypothetical protein
MSITMILVSSLLLPISFLSIIIHISLPYSILVNLYVCGCVLIIFFQVSIFSWGMFVMRIEEMINLRGYWHGGFIWFMDYVTLAYRI